MRDEPVTDEELAAARDYLIGVFPLRFETAGAVGGALAGLVVHGLPVDELVDLPRAHRGRRRAPPSRPRRAQHLHVDEAAIVLVGDADAFGPALEAAGLGPVVIERTTPSSATAPGEPGAEDARPGPVDDEAEAGRRRAESTPTE